MDYLDLASTPYNSMLVLDIGDLYTRTILFDLVDGSYRFIASSNAPTTFDQPLHHLGYGVRMAFESLEQLTGRKFIGQDERIITPTRDDGSGVDTFAVTISAGTPLRIFVVGLAEAVSVESGKRLAQRIYSEIVGSLHIHDHSTWMERLSYIIKADPNIILITGGSEGGASSSVLALAEQIKLACRLIPTTSTPDILFAGNQALTHKIQECFHSTATVTYAANIRPNYDTERLSPGEMQLAQIYRRQRIKQMPGLAELDKWAEGRIVPSSQAFGRIMRFLSLDDLTKGVLGVTIDYSTVTTAVAFGGTVHTTVFPSYLAYTNPSSHPSDSPESPAWLTYHIEQISRWLYIPIAEEVLNDYLNNRSLYPASLPLSLKEAAIEHALIRCILHKAANDLVFQLAQTPTTNQMHGLQKNIKAGLLPFFEPIIGAGSVFSKVPNLSQVALILLDGLQPVGMTSLILDQNNLSAALGTAAAINPTLTVQVIDSNAFLNLGMAIIPLSETKKGTPILRLRVKSESLGDIRMEIKKGEMRVIPIPQDQEASMYIKPLNGADIGLGPGQGGRLNRITGGTLGIIIDARGRPLILPEDILERRDLYKQWLRAFRG